MARNLTFSVFLRVLPIYKTVTARTQNVPRKFAYDFTVPIFVTPPSHRTERVVFTVNPFHFPDSKKTRVHAATTVVISTLFNINIPSVTMSYAYRQN